MIFGKDFDEMFSYTSRMLMCMNMDMAMPMPTIAHAHLPARYVQEANKKSGELMSSPLFLFAFGIKEEFT